MIVRDEDLYRVWNNRVSVAKEYHRKNYLDHIEEVERVWRGLDRLYQATPDLEWVQVNIIYANGKLIVPQIWFSNPEIIVEPLTDRFEEIDPITQGPRTVDVVRNAELVKPVLEQKADQIGFKVEEQRVARDAYLYGMGVMKEGWGSQFGKLGVKKYKDDKHAKPASDKVQQTPVTGVNQKVQPDQPWFLRVHPRDIFLPSWARSYDEMEFVIHRVFRRVDDVKSDKRFRNTEGIEGTRMLFDSSKPSDQQPRVYEQQEEFVELWEIHYRTAAGQGGSKVVSGDQERHNQDMDAEYEPGSAVYKVLVLAEGHDKVLYHDIDEIAMAVGHFPFRFLVLSEDPDRIYPNSDVRQIIDLQRELCKLRSYNLEVVKRQPAKTLVNANAIADPKQEEALLANMPISYVKVNDPDGIKVLVYPGISQDNYAIQERLMQDIRIVGGVGENQQGQATANTATEASIVQSNLNVRTQDMLDKVKDHAIGCFYDLFAMLTEFASEAEIVRVDGPQGTDWRKWTGADIRGHYRFRLDVTQMQPPNNQVRKKMAFDFMNVAITQPQYFNIPEVVRQVAKTYSDVFPNVDALIRENQAPNQAEEILMMMSGQMMPVEPWHNHGEHLLYLEQVMQSPAWQFFPPEVQAVIQQHGMMHQDALRQQGGGKAPATPGGAPQEGVGAVPAMLANKTPTESSIMAGARGGRMPAGIG